MECSIFSNLKNIGISKKKVLSVVDFIGKKVGHSNAALSIHFVGDRRMTKMNNFFRGKDSPTDVLSFAINEGEDMRLSKKKNKEWGDVFVCVPHIKRQAKQHNVVYQEELIRMLSHGVLHLFGYDHERKKDADVMFPLQELIVRKNFT